MASEGEKTDMGSCANKDKENTEENQENTEGKKTGAFASLGALVKRIKERMPSISDDNDADTSSKAATKTDNTKPTQLSYEWEQKLLDDVVVQHESIQRGAIVGFPHGELKAWSPPDFIPENDGLQDVIAAFNGDISGLAEKGISLGCGTNVSVPGKMDEGKAIYGNDGKRGGCSVFKSDHNLLFIVFRSDPAVANRLGLRTREVMLNKGK